MPAQKIKENIYSVGAIDWDRRLFDELIPLPDGTTYNSYLVKGKDKVALIDTVDPTKAGILISNLQSLPDLKVDYIIANHAEQDHSGSIPIILEMYSDAKVVTNQKCKDMLKDLLLVPEDKFIVVADGETLDLGGKTLKFIYTPWVHWPETMVTMLIEDKILFSCDFFGSHLATDQIFVVDDKKSYLSAKRYYAEIMMPFRTVIKGNIDKLAGIDFEIIAPSHGPAHNNPKNIVDSYKDWISDKVKNEVVIPFSSMHHSTLKMVEYLTDKLEEKGISVKPYNLSKTDIGELAMDLVDAATIVLGTPTVLGGAHPQVVYAAFLANALRPKTKFASVIGSYGWGGKAVEQLSGIISNLKVEVVPPVIIKGYPKEGDYLLLEKLADQIVEKHKSLGLL